VRACIACLGCYDAWLGCYDAWFGCYDAWLPFWLRSSQLKAVVNYHQLEPEEVHVVGAEGFGGVLGHAPGHLMLIEQADHEEQGSILDAVLQFACR
jgi:hypothetical protein